MTSTMVYWILMLDNIRLLMAIAFGVGLVVLIVTLIDWSCNSGIYEDKAAKSKRAAMKLIIPIAITASILAFIPSTKQACVIYLAPKVINNEQVQKVPENVLKLLNAKMEEWIGEQIADEPEPATNGGE